MRKQHLLGAGKHLGASEFVSGDFGVGWNEGSFVLEGQLLGNGGPAVTGSLSLIYEAEEMK